MDKYLIKTGQANLPETKFYCVNKNLYKVYWPGLGCHLYTAKKFARFLKVWRYGYHRSDLLKYDANRTNRRQTKHFIQVEQFDNIPSRNARVYYGNPWHWD